MNPEQWLSKVARAIENRPRGKISFWHIVWAAGGVGLWPTTDPIQADHIFGTFGDQELEQGLSCKQWDELKRKIAEYLEGRTK